MSLQALFEPRSPQKDFMESLRLEINEVMCPENKKEYAQFFTPSCIAKYMANLLVDGVDNRVKLLDCGAGIGSLTIPTINTFKDKIKELDTWEIDKNLAEVLDKNLKKLDCKHTVNNSDFIEDAVGILLDQAFVPSYTHVIINPPYKKINSNSKHRRLLRQVGIETVNLYTAFMALSIKLLKENGVLVAIVPRSFCNGLYYKPFRKFLLSTCSIEHIHIFDSRSGQFKEDGVLQENIIIKLKKAGQKQSVKISECSDESFIDYAENVLDFDEVVKNDNPEWYIHIPSRVSSLSYEKFNFYNSIDDIQVNVSTGAVVDFRMKDFLLKNPSRDSIPLVYPHHFKNGRLVYPLEHKKPNAIRFCESIKKLFFPKGYYIAVKRFSSKEEKKRIQAYLITPDSFSSEFIAFENHWNIFHNQKNGLEKELAIGLLCFLNSSILDKYFRVFSGHTQVNATDLKTIKYPSLSQLKVLGEKYLSKKKASSDEIMQEVL